MNILLLILDDLGWPHYGWMQRYFQAYYPHLEPPLQPIFTPHLDRMVAEGVVFPHGHVLASLCRPSIYSFLTGLYAQDVTVRQNAVDLAEHTILPQYLAAAGATLTTNRTTWARVHADPDVTGSDRMGYRGLQAGKWYNGNPLSMGFAATDGGWQDTTPDLGRAGYDDPKRGMAAVTDFISQQNSPWFVWAMPKMPHWPHNAPDRFRQLYTGRVREDYLAMISWTDEQVGVLLDFVRQNQLKDNTLVFLLADNGFALDNAKKNFTENGYRTPLLVWGGGVAPGAVRQHRVNTADLFATLLDVAGVTASEPTIGASFRPLLADPLASWREILLEWHYRGNLWAAQDAQYKVYANLKNGSATLKRIFELSNDPFEDKNLVNDAQVKGACAGLIAQLEATAQEREG